MTTLSQRLRAVVVAPSSKKGVTPACPKAVGRTRPLSRTRKGICPTHNKPPR